MSTIVYQNLVSCFETQFKETTTTVKLKFAAVAPPANLADTNMGPENGNWGLLQTTYPKETVEKTSPYTQHRSSFSQMSAKSLDLCTENLGSESGSDVVTDCSSEVSIFFGSSPFSHSNLIGDSSVEHQKSKQEASPRQMGRSTTKRSDSFPPPLTSMCGPSSMQMCRRREGGRLIIDAVEAPFRNSYLHAERSDGRLRLYFSAGSEPVVPTTSAPEQDGEQECGDEQAEPEEIGEPGSETGSEKEELEGEMSYEMGVEKFQRFGRCKEGGHGSKGLCNVWEPSYCVAT